MTQCREPKRLDLVAVLKQPPDADVEVGDVGTIMEGLPPDGVDVEFLDCDGRICCLVSLCLDDVLMLNRGRTPIGERTFEIQGSTKR